jgi:hypothetical protein
VANRVNEREFANQRVGGAIPNAGENPQNVEGNQENDPLI